MTELTPHALAQTRRWATLLATRRHGSRVASVRGLQHAQLPARRGPVACRPRPRSRADARDGVHPARDLRRRRRLRGGRRASAAPSSRGMRPDARPPAGPGRRPASASHRHLGGVGAGEARDDASQVAVVGLRNLARCAVGRRRGVRTCCSSRSQPSTPAQGRQAARTSSSWSTAAMRLPEATSIRRACIPSRAARKRFSSMSSLAGGPSPGLSGRSSSSSASDWTRAARAATSSTVV